MPLDSPFAFDLVPVKAIDAAEAAALINAAFRRHDVMKGERTSPGGLLEEAGEDAEFLQHRREGRLAAFAMIRPAASVFPPGEGPLPAAQLAKSLYFGLAAVDAHDVNLGLGRALVAEAERIATARGYEQVVLGTVREFGLVEYYARLGYIAMHVEEHPAGHWGVIVPHQYCEMVKAL